jgi:hypothetical protein
MAIIGRLLEAQGFRVGIISQPGWSSAEDFKRLGRPNLFFGITAGNMRSGQGADANRSEGENARAPVMTIDLCYALSGPDDLFSGLRGA